MAIVLLSSSAASSSYPINLIIMGEKSLSAPSMQCH